MVHCGVITGKLLQVVTSLIINSSLTRRPLMSFLSACFEYESDDPLIVFLIPQALIRELSHSLSLFLMSFFDLRAGVDGQASSLDAP